MHFTLRTKLGVQRAVIGNYTTPFPQLVGLIPNGTYDAQAIPLKRRKPVVVLDATPDNGPPRPHDMHEYAIRMPFPHRGASYCTYLCLCQNALTALFNDIIPDSIYIYRVSKK